MQFYLLDITESGTMIELAYGTPGSLKVVGYLFIEGADEMLKILNQERRVSEHGMGHH